jgi:aspartate/methionine/tyrosine aminotransferase
MACDPLPAPGPLPAPARRLGAVLPPVIPQVSAWMGQRPGTLSLAQGMVNWAPPAAVAPALGSLLAAVGRPDGGGPDPEASASLDRYGAMEGDGPLLERLRHHLVGHHRLDLDGAALLVTAGSNMAFNAVAQVILDPGDTVLLPVPWYFNHWMAIQLAGGVPVAVDAGVVPDPALLAAAITPRTRAIVTVSPGNPSGVVIPPPVLAAINRLCAERGLWHISDEAYAAFVHGAQPHRSPGILAGSGAHTITLHTFSKAYGMAGWRLGYATVPRPLMAGLAQVQDTILICPPRLMQQAAVAALEAGPAWVAPRVAGLAPRRRQVLEAVAAARRRGLPLELVAEPDGAFYALLACSTPLSGEELVRRLVLEHGVALLPGEAFGLVPQGGTSTLRLSYGMLEGALLQEALDRLVGGLEQLSQATPQPR